MVPSPDSVNVEVELGINYSKVPNFWIDVVGFWVLLVLSKVRVKDVKTAG